MTYNFAHKFKSTNMNMSFLVYIDGIKEQIWINTIWKNIYFVHSKKIGYRELFLKMILFARAMTGVAGHSPCPHHYVWPRDLRVSSVSGYHRNLAPLSVRLQPCVASSRVSRHRGVSRAPLPHYVWNRVSQRIYVVFGRRVSHVVPFMFVSSCLASWSRVTP